jgi:amidophosphoribosyltransferase
MDGASVYESRLRMGGELARKIANIPSANDIDVVIPIPDSSRPSALELANSLGLKYREGFVKNRYVGRTFIMPGQAIRKKSVRQKLNPMGIEFKDKVVLLVDDSIVRGTTSRKLVRMVREAGATEVHMRISCPPTISPCYYGVDTPTREELIASSNTPAEICRFLGADSLGYLSLPGLRQAVNDTEGNFCTSCYTGVYPTDLVQLEVREGNSLVKLDEAMTVQREG